MFQSMGLSNPRAVFSSPIACIHKRASDWLQLPYKVTTSFLEYSHFFHFFSSTYRLWKYTMLEGKVALSAESYVSYYINANTFQVSTVHPTFILPTLLGNQHRSTTCVLPVIVYRSLDSPCYLQYGAYLSRPGSHISPISFVRAFSCPKRP